MNRRAKRQPHWVCATTGACLCSGIDLQCDCDRTTTFVNPVVGDAKSPVRVDLCARCKMAMVCIDFATGALIEPRTDQSDMP